MQVDLWDPIMFVLICLAFLVFFLAFMYSKGMLWFQQTDESGTDNWLTRYHAKDEATGSWGRRFVIPAAALFLLIAILSYFVTNVLELSSFQKFIFLIFDFSTTLIISIFFVVRLARINRHVLETSTEDPFPDASEESDDLG